MVVGDPAAELLDLVRAGGDPAPCSPDPAAARRAALIRRRFSLSLPPPFVTVGDGSAHEDDVDPAVTSAADSGVPVRPAEAVDGAAIAAVKWRAFGTNYRGVFPDRFLDGRDVVPPPGYWTGRAMRPPSRLHRLLVWGEPGTVLGYLDCGPMSDTAVPDPIHESVAATGRGTTAEIFELYVDPCAQGRGGGRALLDHAEARLRELGFVRAVLSAVATNTAAHAFYRSRGWTETGERIPVDLGVVAFEELRFSRELTPPGSTGGFWGRMGG